MRSGVGYFRGDDFSAISQTNITKILIALTDTCD